MCVLNDWLVIDAQRRFRVHQGIGYGDMKEVDKPVYSEVKRSNQTSERKNRNVHKFTISWFWNSGGGLSENRVSKRWYRVLV